MPSPWRWLAVVEYDQADAGFLAVLRMHPAHGGIAFRPVRDEAGPVSDFVVERVTGAAVRLLEPKLGPGTSLRRAAESCGRDLVGELVRLVADGGWVQVRLPTGDDPDPGIAVDTIAVGDRVVGLLDPGDARGRPVQERGFRALVEAAVDVIHVLEPSGVTRYISPGAAAVLGYEPQELVGRHYREMVDPRDLPMVEQAFADVL